MLCWTSSKMEASDWSKFVCYTYLAATTTLFKRNWKKIWALKFYARSYYLCIILYSPDGEDVVSPPPGPDDGDPAVPHHRVPVYREDGGVPGPDPGHRVVADLKNISSWAPHISSVVTYSYSFHSARRMSPHKGLLLCTFTIKNILRHNVK